MHRVLVWGKDASEGNLMRLRYKENTGWWPLVKWLMFYFHRSLESLYICTDPPKTEPVSAHFPQGYFSITKCLSYFWCLNWYDFFFFNIKAFYYKAGEKSLQKSVLHAFDHISLAHFRQKNQMHNTRINFNCRCVHVYSCYALVHLGCFKKITLDWWLINKHEFSGH